jgi:hypothetical protein
MATQPSVEDIWRAIFSGQFPALRRGHHLRGRIPAKARCKNCKAPFDGPGAFLMRWLGRGQYHRNPRFCDF